LTHYAGLDVSMNTTFICIVNEKGKVVKELEAVSTLESIDSFLSGTGLEIEKVGLESGRLTHYLKKGLKEKGYKVIGTEPHKMAAILATIINKTDKNEGCAFSKESHFRINYCLLQA
jgi:transposase